MKSLWILAVLALVSCTSSPPSQPPVTSTVSSVPVLQAGGPSNILGLELNLDPRLWNIVLSDESTVGLEYAAGRDCQGTCAQLLVANGQSQFYRLSTLKDGTVFKTETECAIGSSAFDTAQEREGWLIDGRLSQYFVNPPCLVFSQNPQQKGSRENWFFPEERLLLQKVRGIHGDDGAVDAVLKTARWK